MTDIGPKPGAKIFLTKVWGFQPDAHPFVGFSQEGGRRKFLSEANRGDWIVFAGTKTANTHPDEQGRLLGMVEVGHDKVNARDVLDAIGTQIGDHELDDAGNYKWPWAMPMLRAVRFDPAPGTGKAPDTSDVLGSYLNGQDWAAYAIDLEERLGADAVQKVLALPYTDCEVHDIPQFARQRTFADNLNLNRKDGPTGPPPSASRSGSERELGEGYAYALELHGGKIKAFKVGSAHDPAARLTTLNNEIRTSVTGCHWEPILQQKFQTESMAYNFEQSVLKQLKDRKVPGETEILDIPRQDLESAWTRKLMEKKWMEEPSGD